MVNPSTCDRAQGIALYLPQRPGAMRGGRNTHGGTVVLGVGLRTVPPQKEPPQIGHMAAEKRGQFRVRALFRRKGLWERADQVTNSGVHGAILRCCGHNA